MKKQQRLIIISNRLPIQVTKDDDGLKFSPSIGGLATGLRSFQKQHNVLWIGWPGIDTDHLDASEKNKIKIKLIEDLDCYPVFLTKEDIKYYYAGFCNKTIWPLFHYFTQFVDYDNRFWKSYKLVNEMFYEKASEIIKSDDIVWIQDYHLLLLPKLIRSRYSDVNIGFFLHIPFPSYEIFRLLPRRNELLEGMLGSDLIGFHIYDYVRHFKSSAHRILGAEVEMNKLYFKDREVNVDSFAMGIDYEKFSKAALTDKTEAKVNKIREELGDVKIILSVDRMDYTKGILQRLEAFESFLEKYEEYRTRVTLVFIVAPSRLKVEEYQVLKGDIDEFVGKINGLYSTIGWVPIMYIHQTMQFKNLVAFYKIADAALITPVRDGMNLIAKEYLSCKTEGKGVLILSETAGAAKQLPEAILVNTNNKEEMVEAIFKAMTMSDEEQARKLAVMQERLKNKDVFRWAEDFVDTMIQLRNEAPERTLKFLDSRSKEKLIENYLKSDKRLIILDYDGTLVEFVKDPNDARPDEELLSILNKLAMDDTNNVYIVSGRDKKDLDKWLGDMNIGLVAEHGFWIKEIGDEWEQIEPIKTDWKDGVRSIMERYVDRTLNSFIEEKEISLAWHYRSAESELGAIRARELEIDLLNYSHNLNLQVLHGNKVVEIRYANINKGRIVSRLISTKDSSFLLIVGDDATDEDMFAIAPESAFSIKVGLQRTKARFNIISSRATRLLLKDLIESEKYRLEVQNL
ncbi:MAG: bifunctional alpha,alpha-trehalose-phosphate synthase (UDP-forming)/trehalose-phosphatase [Candidatus Lokiarchaeota archaeon]|nr:bifunctional alpha,alpha-trehalose-phosphate synthase (UDP-forming)/trehalose-phosphatase [Candidatus Lokiarchaeota archaeon]